MIEVLSETAGKRQRRILSLPVPVEIHIRHCNSAEL